MSVVQEVMLDQARQECDMCEQALSDAQAEIERLTTTLENMCQRLEQIQYDHNTCDGDLVLEEARAILAKKEGKG